MAINFGVGFNTTRQTIPRTVVKAIVFSSGDMRIRETIPSYYYYGNNNSKLFFLIFLY